MPYESLDEHFVRGVRTPFGRKIWTARSTIESAKTAIIFLDAELYIDKVKAPSVVKDLHETGSLPATLAMFVSNMSAKARHSDYPCNPTYAKFLAIDLVTWLLTFYPTVDRIVLAGLSLSGLAAAFAATRYPDHFHGAICQSPSFWWENERFCASAPHAPARAPKFWVSVGDEETSKDISHPPSGMLQRSSQIESCERTRDVLMNREYPLHYQIFRGAHDPQCWRRDLILALPWACS